MKTVALHDLLDARSTPRILARMAYEVESALARRIEHSRHGILHRVGHAGRENIYDRVYEVAAKLSVVAVPDTDIIEAALGHTRVYRHDGAALTGIRKYLRRR
jgi:hypothetical protein